MYPIYAFGSEEQKQKYLPRMARGELYRLLRPHRAAWRVGSRQHEDARETPRRGLGDQRREDVDHQRRHRGSVRRLGADGRRHPRLHRREGHAGLRRARDRTQVLACAHRVTSSLFFDNVVVPEENLLPGVVGLKGPLSCLTQARYGITWGVIGCGAGLPHADAGLHEDARAVRPAARGEPGDPDPARRHVPGITTAQLLSLQLGRLKDKGEMTPSQVSLGQVEQLPDGPGRGARRPRHAGRGGHQCRIRTNSVTCSTSKVLLLTRAPRRSTS